MSRDQFQQNKRPQVQQNRQEKQTQKNSGNESGKYISGGISEEKSTAAEMLAAVEALINGVFTEKSVEAASCFGNQLMLNMAEQSALQKNGIKSAGMVLDGETDCVFGNDTPISEIAAEPAFPPESVPDFSPDVPVTDIIQVGQFTMQYLI